MQVIQLVRFVHATRLATQQEIHDEFIRLGFRPEDNGEYYTNGQHDIFDAVDGNVLVGDDGHIYFIDTIIYPSDTGGGVHRRLSLQSVPLSPQGLVAVEGLLSRRPKATVPKSEIKDNQLNNLSPRRRRGRCRRRRGT